MHIAVGYQYYPAAAGFHLESALTRLGDSVTYVGLPTPERPGFDSGVDCSQILSYLDTKCDLFLWIDPAGRYFPRGIENLPIPSACYLIDVHLGHWREQAARFFDFVFLAQRDYLPRFREAVGHDRVYWLPLGANPEVHKDHGLDRDLEVGFVGNISIAHRNTARARRLERIAANFRTNDFGRSYAPAEVGKTYSRSRIVFNTSIAGDVTMRVFEGTACGALVVTDSIGNGLEDLFEIGRELVVFDGDDDLERKIRYYLANREEAEAIALAGKKRTLSSHTYSHRVTAILDTVFSTGDCGGAPMRKADERERLAARRIVYTHLHMLDAVLDLDRDAGRGAIMRMVDAAPVLARRVLRS